jgi:hypothetical protein
MIKIEKSLRLPHFHEDVPIVLGNGETFHIRPPRFGFCPRVMADGAIETAFCLNYGPEWEARVAETLEKEFKDDELFTRVIWFVDRMLLRNYKEEIRAYYPYLLFLSPDEPDGKERIYALWDIARGFNPKGISSDTSRHHSS